MLIFYLSLIASLVLLSYSSDYFIDGAIDLAKHFNVSKLTIGIVVLGFGTSAPEILISIISAIEHLPGLAVGNVIGSNIANIGLVLGTAVLIYPIAVSKTIVRFDVLLVVCITAFIYLIIVWDQKLSSIDGILILLAMVITIFLIIRQKTQEKKEIVEKEATNMPLSKTITITLISLIVLVLSARLLVWSASSIALHWGISETIIGLTIVAIGTSLPELAAAISASLKKHPELTVGNILGSNLFNLLAVLPFPAFFGGLVFSPQLMWFDTTTMILFTLALPIAILLGKRYFLSRFWGGLLLFGYIFYIVMIIYLESLAN